MPQYYKDRILKAGATGVFQRPADNFDLLGAIRPWPPRVQHRIAFNTKIPALSLQKPKRRGRAPVLFTRDLERACDSLNSIRRDPYVIGSQRHDPLQIWIV